jgi:hypothetical protein
MRHRWTTTVREVDPLSLIFINFDNDGKAVKELSCVLLNEENYGYII